MSTSWRMIASGIVVDASQLTRLLMTYVVIRESLVFSLPESIRFLTAEFLWLGILGLRWRRTTSMIALMENILCAYADFFSFAAFWDVVTTPENWGVVGTLVLLEGLLSADNALVLAVMVKHLSPIKQRKALFYGILGAYLFRFLAIGIGVFLIQIWWIKIIGALYLLWLPIKQFCLNSQGQRRRANLKSMGFWHTVLAVEIMDIAFSVDSVLAALGVSEEIWVLYLGGVIGILMMRGVAQIFLTLLERCPRLEMTAYVLIAIIGLKMLGAAFDFHVSQVAFFATVISLFLGTFVLQHLRVHKW